MRAEERARVGVDIGGTFTDVALEYKGKLHSTKVLTDHAAPERAIITGIRLVIADAGLRTEDIGVVIHGTTLAANAIIERRGAWTAFVTTEGFRDTIEMRTESRFDQYDLNLKLPTALIERSDRYTLSERMDAQGTVLVSPDEAAVSGLVDEIAERGYESVAIGFIHAYVNGAHERLMRDAILRKLPKMFVSISSEVSSRMRELERFNTVCANAYVQPIMKSYLDRLLGEIRAVGANCEVYVIHSGGGLVSLESAAAFPVRLVESGPAGGALFAASIAARYALNRVVSFDMGGTTAKVCLIDNLSPKTANTFELARTYRFKKGSGMPVSIPVVEMVEIGAGGGSIAHLDVMRQIRVGPQSAASEPGPACYQRGGTRSTVTDADLLLGRLDAKSFAGGSIPLDASASARAIHKDIGAALGYSSVEAAHGISEVVDENMSNAARVHAVESGRDIRDYTMIAFGGAGPVHAARLCEKVGINRLLVPPGAGVGSAIGFLRAPFSYESVRSANMTLSGLDPALVEKTIGLLTDEVTAVIRRGTGLTTPEIEVRAFMRYVGQGWEIPVTIPGLSAQYLDRTSLDGLFTRTYREFFGRSIEGLDIEIVSWAVRASSPVPRFQAEKLVSANNVLEGHAARRKPVFDGFLNRFVDAALFDRDSLAAGDCVVGPAVVVERETATIVSSSFVAIVQPDGCLLLQAKERIDEYAIG